MSQIESGNENLFHKSTFINEDYENDDLITFQLDSKKINIYYSQLTKYSKRIREQYLFSDVKNKLSQDIHEFIDQYQLSLDNVFYFFQLLQQNYNIKENSILTYIECINLLKISKFLSVRKLSDKINEYIKNRKIDVDFIIQIIEYEIKTRNPNDNSQFEINKEMEKNLIKRIDECFLNEKFSELPISTIYRIIEKSAKKRINNDNLFDFIKKSINKFFVLFPFLDLKKLSNDKLEELCELYSKTNENDQEYYNYLKCNLNLIKEINESKKNLQEKINLYDKTNQAQQNEINELETKINQLQNQIKESESNKQKIQLDLEISEQKNQQQEKKMKDLEIQIKQLQDQLKSSDQNNIELQKKLKNSEEEINNLQKRLEDEISSIKGQIIASVKDELLINAKINIAINDALLDTARSKYIISTSDVKTLGIESYEKGEQITSSEMDTIDFMCKPGTYYVHCIIFDKEGKSKEFVSNSITTSGKSVLFKFEGKGRKISLLKGKYKLEVWGAEGGKSIGTRQNSSSPGEGGLGGYSSGILNLNQNETIHIYVGGKGCPAKSTNGAITEGGFPDGGSTKTGNRNGTTSVPGTGGCSTSIRMRNDSNYSRLIVAGGGGGASGCSCYTDQGGYGGGLSGGGCYYKGNLQNQGFGTQTGSTCGLGWGSEGDPGIFGHGASGKYNSISDSGGGGGGGWYGGGSGGYGSCYLVSSGGGGSGWTFTESNFKSWQSGDPTNASKFNLDSSCYLSNESSIAGNLEFPKPDGNGIERGHTGNGYARITPT